MGGGHEDSRCNARSEAVPSYRMQVLARRRRLEWQQRTPAHRCSSWHLRTGKVRHGDRARETHRIASARQSVNEQRTGCLKARRKPRRIGFTDLSQHFSKRRIMGVNWSKDVDQTLATAKEQSRPILMDFSAAPA